MKNSLTTNTSPIKNQGIHKVLLPIDYGMSRFSDIIDPTLYVITLTMYMYRSNHKMYDQSVVVTFVKTYGCTKAVSERFISAEIFCIRLSDSGSLPASRTHTPAGLPVNGE